MKIAGGLKTVGSLWIAQVLKLVLSILVSILVIRYLGPEQYGVLGIASACVVLFSALVGLPQGGLVVRHRFEMQRGAKKIIWRNARPYGVLAGSGEQIRFDLLHCQGIGKMYMANLAANRSPVDVRGVAVESAMLQARKFKPKWVSALLK